MTNSKKLALALWGATLLVMGAIGGCYWWVNRVPTRPAGIATDAVFLRAPNVGLPAHRRGWWLFCWSLHGDNYCKLSDIEGNTEYEGRFIAYHNNGASVPADELSVNARETEQTETKVWVGTTLVPIVFLENGKVLIPATKYEEGKQLVERFLSKSRTE